MIIAKKTQILLEPGTYLAEISAIEETTGQFGQQLKFTFNLLDQEDDISLTGWTSTNYSEKSKLFDWSRNIYGSKFDPAAACDTDKLLNRKVVLNVSQRQSTDGTKFNRIETLIHYRQQPKQLRAEREEEIITQMGFAAQTPAPANFED